MYSKDANVVWLSLPAAIVMRFIRLLDLLEIFYTPIRTRPAMWAYKLDFAPSHMGPEGQIN